MNFFSQAEVVKKYLSANPDEYYDNIKDTKVFKLSNTVKGIEYNKNRYVLLYRIISLIITLFTPTYTINTI